MKLVTLLTLAVLIAVIGTGLAFAGQHDGPSGRGGMMGPPPEAYEACKDKSEGDSVGITTPRGDTLEAVCKKVDNRLVAEPENMPASPQGDSFRR